MYPNVSDDMNDSYMDGAVMIAAPISQERSGTSATNESVAVRTFPYMYRTFDGRRTKR